MASIMDEQPTPLEPNEDSTEFGSMEDWNDVAQFAGCVGGPLALIAVVGLQTLFSVLGMLDWVQPLLIAGYLSVPTIALGWWGWKKPGIILPNGRVIRRYQFRHGIKLILVMTLGSAILWVLQTFR
jgi:hypothetical protein